MIRLSLNETDYLIWRKGSGNSIEIYDIVVGSDRRKGQGRKLIQELVSKVSPETKLIFAICRKSNRIAHQFYKAVGFRPVGYLRDFYNDDKGVEGAIMFGLDL